LLWLNSNSNGKREQNALHAACPIIEGRKIAVSLWIRSNLQARKLIKVKPYQKRFTHSVKGDMHTPVNGNET